MICRSGKFVSIVLLLGAIASAPASAVDVWAGGSWPDFYKNLTDISKKCGEVTGKQEYVDKFLTSIRLPQSKVNEQILKLIEDTKTYKDAEANHDTKKIDAARESEAKKMRFKCSCYKTPVKISVTAQNSDGKSVEIAW